MPAQPQPLGRYMVAAKNGAEWLIANKRSGAALGRIVFCDEWRCWVFQPFAHTEFSAGCLHDLNTFLRSRNGVA